MLKTIFLDLSYWCSTSQKVPMCVVLLYFPVFLGLLGLAIASMHRCCFHSPSDWQGMSSSSALSEPKVCPHGHKGRPCICTNSPYNC